jgi:hypothetical protein
MPVTSLPARVVERVAGRLRFPALFLLTALLFLVNLAIPDPLPFVDEILLGLATLLLGAWKDRRGGGDGVDVETSTREP